MNSHADAWPERIGNEAELEELLTRPSPALRAFIPKVASPLVVLGAGGKMGPSLAVLAKRAATEAGHQLDIIAVSRFQDASARHGLEAAGVKTLSCDLLDAASVARLPEAANVIYLVGLKFGTAQNPSLTWAMNTIVPWRVAERYPQARLVALSTGNVYPFSAVSRGGSVETDPLTPVGEYANAAVARERLFEFFARRQNSPLALLRLFYAVDLRYGVVVDLARRILQGEPVPLANGFFNCIWQGDANEFILRSLALASAPPAAFNLCRPEVFSVRDTARQLGERLGRTPHFQGEESPTALLGNSARLCAQLGPPAVTLDRLIDWAAHWVQAGGKDLGRPTHFEVRDGQY